MKTECNPFVSVVIPTYNHAEYLHRALLSVFNQTYVNWEVIVVDNHSTDKTEEVISSFNDPRLLYLKIHNNGVIAASRNAAIQIAKGEWVAFLDSDDWWASNKLQTCIDRVGDNIDFIYHDLKIVRERTGLCVSAVNKSWQLSAPVLIDLLVRGNAISTSSAFVRTFLLRQIGGMDQRREMIAAEDYNTWLRIAQFTDHFKYIPYALGYYQVHSQSVSSIKDMSVPARFAAEAFVSRLDSYQKKRFEGNLSYTRGRYNYRARNYKAATNDIINAFKYGRHTLKPKLIWMFIMIVVFRRK
ncbi:glycosyltransferase family 2 protein [Desulfosediminicola sp.]|uniref:glycosyltransferase family 2 protein n=1 Tax=Desulfosediminicola sp. TaxID=2886825 RepID=UPI003AF20517